jgi:hypothetical protein
MRWDVRTPATIGILTYGEVVWSRPPDAEVKLVRSTLLRGDGDYQARHTGEITK